MAFSRELIQKINKDVDDIVENYRDISVEDLARSFGVNIAAKNALNPLITKMIDASGTDVLAELRGRNMIIKTVRLDKYGQLKESMSFPVFKYCDIVRESWETSDLRKQFYQKTFVFAVFRGEEKQMFLNKIVVWEMPLSILDNEVSRVWQSMHDHLLKGEVVKYIDDNGRYFSFFPASSENPYVHVRPHAQNKKDTYPLPVPDKLTGLIQYSKHSFWLNRSYVSRIIEEEDER